MMILNITTLRRDCIGACLVKGIPFDIEEDSVSGGDIFRQLISMEIHEYSSLYSSLKDDLLRTVNNHISVRDDSLRYVVISLSHHYLYHYHCYLSYHHLYHYLYHLYHLSYHYLYHYLYHYHHIMMMIMKMIQMMI